MQKEATMSMGIAELRQHLKKVADPQNAWAAKNGIAAAYVSDVIRGRADPGEKILDALGFEKVVTYRKKAKSNG